MKKSELRQIIREELMAMTESKSTRYEDHLKFQRYIEKKYDGRSLKGWHLDVEYHSGGFGWTSPTGKTVVYATPFWEDKEQLPIEVVDVDGDSMIEKTHPFKWNDDFKKMEAEYIKIITMYFKKSELREIIREELQKLNEQSFKRDYIYGSETELPFRYDFTVGKYNVDVTASKIQGRPGSNMVVITEPEWNGYALGTPKKFSTVKDAESFVKKSIPALKSGKVGKLTPIGI